MHDIVWQLQYTVEPAMSSHSYEQPTSYVRPLDYSQQCFFVYKWTSYGQPPALKCYFSCATRVAAHSKFYCKYPGECETLRRFLIWCWTTVAWHQLWNNIGSVCLMFAGSTSWAVLFIIFQCWLSKGLLLGRRSNGGIGAALGRHILFV